jgi:hypothetical protein
MSKSITYGLLAFAVSSSLLVAQGEKPAGGWSAKAGSGITYDGGDQFGINMLNFVQARWAYTDVDSDSEFADSNTFDVPRARTLLRGHAFNKNINYVLQVDYMSGSSSLTTDENDDIDGVESDSIVRDAYVHWNFADGIGLRLGQGKTQWGLENTGTIRGTMFTERSSASQLFSLSGSFDLENGIEEEADIEAALSGDNSRTRGVWLMGTNMDNKLRWSAGLVNGIGTEEAPNDDNEFGFVASANYDLLGDYFGGQREWWSQGDLRDGDRNLKGTVGVGYGMDNNNPGPNAGADLETTAYNVNTAWSVQGFQVMGEWYQAKAEEDTVAGDLTLSGYYVQGTYALGKSGDSAMRYAVGLRYSSVDLGELYAFGDTLDVNDISLVVDALYNGHNCKTQLELTQRTTDDGGDDDLKDYVLGVAFQLVF